MLGGTTASERRWWAPSSSTSRRNKDDAVFRSTTPLSFVTAPMRDCPTGLRKVMSRITKPQDNECSFSALRLSTKVECAEKAFDRAQGRLPALLISTCRLPHHAAGLHWLW